MEDLEECMKYFREREYKRIFRKMREKYESYGKWEGNILLEHPTIGEKEALSGFMKKDYQRNKSITISLKNFERRLQETRFSKIPLKTIIENYDEKPLISKKSKAAQEKKEEEAFYQEILEKNQDTKIYPILQTLLQEKTNHSLKMHYTKDRHQLKQALQNACDCLKQLPKQKMKLPIFSARTMKNPHGLDKDTLTGQIFAKLLAIQNKQKEPKGAEELAELYYQNNLLVDDVSNMVLCKNIRAYTKKRRTLSLEGILGRK